MGFINKVPDPVLAITSPQLLLGKKAVGAISDSGSPILGSSILGGPGDIQALPLMDAGKKSPEKLEKTLGQAREENATKFAMENPSRGSFLTQNSRPNKTGRSILTSGVS
jgi:hypothetical protein